MKPSNNNPDREPIETETIQIETRTLTDGSYVFAVPSPLPPNGRLVFGHSAPNEPTRIMDMVLTMPRSEVENYANFLARHGAIDREPTPEEITTMLQLVGNHMVQMQMDLMAMLSEVLIDRLGNGDREESAARVTQSLADSITSEAINGGALPAEEATDAADLIARALEQWASGKVRDLRNGKKGDSE